MRPRIDSSQKKQQPEAGDKNVREEARLEENLNFIQPMGNEAANTGYLNQKPQGANENNILDLTEFVDQEEDFVPRGGRKQDPFIDPEADDPNNSMYLNSSHNIVNENNMVSRNNISRGRLNLISNESDSENSESIIRISNKKSDKQKNKKKPEQKDAKKALEVAEKIAEKPDEFPALSTYAPDADLAAVKGRGKSGRKIKSKNAPENILESPEKAGTANVKGIDDARWKDAAVKRLMEVELENASPEDMKEFRADEMQKLKNWNFDAQKLDDVSKKRGKKKSFLSYLAGGMGKLLSLALEIITFGHFWRAKSTARFLFTDTDKWQLTKDYQNIPGWNGAKFDPGATRGEDVAADFRRVPTVWSRLIAAKAADTVQRNGQAEEKPLDPVVSVMVKQPIPGTAETMDGREMGHTMIGIEYSRKSAISGRYERYKLQYGFYPAGMGRNISTGMTMLRHDAKLPGQLRDDYGDRYDIGRRYPASPEQVNDIFAASEKYAEGGYSYYDRNCATFVKEMVVNTAHLTTGGDIFEKAEVGFSHLANLGLFGSEAFEQNSKAGTENRLMDLMNQEDTSYQNYGNKRGTKRDYVNYRKSMNKSGSMTRETYIPAQIGERLRRMEGDQTGEISSYKFNEPMKNKKGEVLVGLEAIQSAIDKYGSELQEENFGILKNIPQDQAPIELNNLTNFLNMMGDPLTELEGSIRDKISEENKKNPDGKKIKREKAREYYFLTPDELRNAREKLSENISKVNILLNNYLKNDQSVHQPLLNMISLLNYAIEYVDELYQKCIRGGSTIEDGEVILDDIREEMTNRMISVKAGEEDASFTPTHYESYIQIYKDPETAIKKYNRLKVLREKKKNSGNWTKSKVSTLKHKIQSTFNAEDETLLTFEEARELNTLERLEDLALDFDRSHNYMLEKNSYKQQDIDYAFQLHNKETNGLQKADEVQPGKNDISQDVRDKYKSASGIYITLFMNKFFSDLKEQWMKDPDEGGISLDEAGNPPAVYKWMDKYLSDRIKRKKNGFEMLVKGIYRSIKSNDPNKIVEEKEVMDRLSNMILEICINRNFEGDYEAKAVRGYLNLSSAITMIPNNKSSEYTKLVSDLFHKCDLEDSGLELQFN